MNSRLPRVVSRIIPDAAGGWQFSLYGLMLMVAAVGVAAGRAHAGQADWSDHLLAGLAFLLVFGLIHQARALWLAHRHHAWRSSAARGGWIFAVGWRVALSALILALLVAEHLHAYEVLSWEESEETFYKTGRMAREALLRLSLAIGVAGAATGPLSRRPSGGTDLLGWVALLVLCLVLCVDASLLPVLVHVALRGIEAARAWTVFGVARNPQAYVDLTDVTDLFFHRAALSAALIPLNLALTAGLAWQWQRGLVRRLLIALPLTAGLAVPLAFATWAARRGFTAISPGLGPFLVIEPLYRWVLVIVLLGLASAAGGAEFCYRANGWEPISDVTWERQPSRDFHQQTWFLLALMVPFAAHVLSGLWDAIWSGGRWSDSPGDLMEFVYYTLSDTTMAFDLALFLVATRLIRASCGQVANGRLAGPFAVSLPAWAAVSSALFLTLAAGVPTLYWLGFAGWLRAGRI